MSDNASPHTVKSTQLGFLGVVFITVVSVDSIRNLPETALFGSHLFVMFLLATISFLLPCGIITAELSSTELKDPSYCGIYAWFKEAFGPRVACFGVWLQWIENVVWYPTMLSYIAGTLAYLIDPTLVHNKVFLMSCILGILWVLTFLNLKGIKSSTLFSHICTILGLFLPMTLIIGQGILWYFSGKPVAIDFQSDHLWPHFQDPSTWVALTGIMLSFCGMELATVHGPFIHNPRKTIPRAMMLSIFIIASTLLAGGLAIALVIPAHEINLISGMMQAFSIFFGTNHPSFLILLGIMLILGALGGLNNWILAPCESLWQVSKDGHLPHFFAKTNEQGSPYGLLILQAIVVTLASFSFLWIPSVNGSYWFLGALTSQIYMLMYILLFLAGIKLRFTHSKRLFQIPGGLWVLIPLVLLGITSCLLTIAIGFFPPGHHVQVGNHWAYPFKVLLGFLFFVVPGLLIFSFKKTISQGAKKNHGSV